MKAKLRYVLAIIFILITLSLALFLPISFIMFVASSILSFLVMLLLHKVLFIHESESHNTYIYTVFSFLLMFGVIYSLNAYNGYGNFFGTVSDDSAYFYRSLDVLNKVNIGVSSIFEYISAFLLKFISLFVSIDKFSVIYLLPFSYCLVSLGIESINKIFYKIYGKSIPIHIFAIVYLLNYNIVSNSIPFYREAYALFLFPLTIYYILNDKNIISIILILIMLTVRGAFSMLLLSFFVLKLFYKNRLKKMYLIFIFISIFGVYGLFDYITPYISFFGSNGYSTDVLSTRLSLRIENITGVYAVLYSNPIFRIFFFMLSPNSLIPITSNVNVTQHISTWNTVKYTVNMTNYLAVLSSITTIPIPYLIPRIMLGVKNTIFSSKSDLSLLGIFITYSWLFLSIFSMQVRHFTVLIIFYPIFLYSFYLNDDKNNKNLIILITAILYCVILLLSML